MSTAGSVIPQADIQSLYQDHHGWLQGWLRRRLGCAADAADLAHDTFVRLLNKSAFPRFDSFAEARAYLAGIFPSVTGDMFECTPDEGRAAFLHRFAVAGAAVRYRAVHAREVEDIVALDIALRRNDQEWMERLPPEIDAAIAKKLYYGHFFCHVFHQDYVVRKGHDCLELEHAMWRLLDARGAEYPAEHNVGHLYKAKPALAEFYRRIDPTNSLNPGVGQTSKCAHWH